MFKLEHYKSLKSVSLVETGNKDILKRTKYIFWKVLSYCWAPGHDRVWSHCLEILTCDLGSCWWSGKLTKKDKMYKTFYEDGSS